MTEGLLRCCKIKQRMYFNMLKRKCTISEYKQYKNKLTIVLRTAKRDYFANFIINHKQNFKAMWGMINSNLGRYNKKSFNSLSHSPNELNDFFVE